MTTKDPNRYRRRHTWYLADALRLLQSLQAELWPCNWHAALGGGVLTHGYSDNDLDVYVLPIYRTDSQTAVGDAEDAVDRVLGLMKEDLLPLSIAMHPTAAPHECYARALMYSPTGIRGRVDVFIIKPFNLANTLNGESDDKLCL